MNITKFLNKVYFAPRLKEINGSGSWEKDPWVWVIEFKKLEQA
jgi:hypothetical protein